MREIRQLFDSEEAAKAYLQNLVKNGYTKSVGEARAEGEFWFRKILAVEVCFLQKKHSNVGIPVPAEPHTIRPGSPCIISGCEGKSRSRGLCNKCWGKYYYAKNPKVKRKQKLEIDAADVYRR